MFNAPMAIDHIVLAARSLDEGVAYIQDQLGADIGPGGTHPRMGTHNRLMSLGATYLELIAVDPNASPPGRSRCFNLDHFDGAPRLLTWVLRTSDIDAALSQAPKSCGVAINLSRGDLHWRLSVPKDGSMPFEGAFPSFIEWPGNQSPVSQMVDRGCRLSRLIVRHPQAGEISTLLGDKVERNVIDVQDAMAVSLRAEIETPSGLRVLS